MATLLQSTRTFCHLLLFFLFPPPLLLIIISIVVIVFLLSVCLNYHGNESIVAVFVVGRLWIFLKLLSLSVNPTTLQMMHFFFTYKNYFLSFLSPTLGKWLQTTSFVKSILIKKTFITFFQRLFVAIIRAVIACDVAVNVKTMLLLLLLLSHCFYCYFYCFYLCNCRFALNTQCWKLATLLELLTLWYKPQPAIRKKETDKWNWLLQSIFNCLHVESERDAYTFASIYAFINLQRYTH